jgi:peptidoglycan-associated lipoprotein
MSTRHTGTIVGVAILILTVGCGKTLESSVSGQAFQSEQPKPKMRNAMPVAVGAPDVVAPRPSPSLSSPETLPVIAVASEPDSASGENVVPLQIAKVDPQAAASRLEEISGTRESGIKDIYFAFDSWMLTAEARQALVTDAQWLQAHPAASVTIEGHCDERGTLAYNLVLGEKRAQAVKTYLTDLGVAPEMLRVVSYGKERPVCLEHDETCYQKNRRGHLATAAAARVE